MNRRLKKGNGLDRKSLVYVFVLLEFCLVSFGCNALKKRKDCSVKSSDSIVVPSNIQKLDGIHRHDWNNINGKAGVDFNDGEHDVNASISFRMKKDSIVWILATYLGFEVGRVKIDKDSAFILNRAQGNYFVYGLNELNNYLGVNVSLRQFQNILIANPVLDTSTYDLLPSSPNKLFVQSNGQLKNTLGVNSDGMMIFESLLQPLAQSNQNLIVNYKNYSSDGGLLLPRIVNLLANSNGKKIKINLDIKEINTQVLNSYPFTIPSTYERKN